MKKVLSNLAIFLVTFNVIPWSVLLNHISAEIVDGKTIDIHTMTLYSGLNKGGDFIVFNYSESKDLKLQNFDKKAKFICFRGVWLLYENPNFEEIPENGLVRYFFAPFMCCHGLGFISEKVSSIRFAGWRSSYKAATITFFEGTFFRGKSQFYAGNHSSLTHDLKKIRSAIITGITGNAYTLYAEKNYQGMAKCLYLTDLYVTNFLPSFFQDLDLEKAGFPDGSIQSIRHGCFTEKIKAERKVMATAGEDNNVNGTGKCSSP